jgi:uncharacterized protein (TIGR00730 family)
MAVRRVCVFCGANAGRDGRFAAAADAFGDALAERGIGLVYGGGGVGLMGAVADAALARGGEVIGVIPRALVDRELAHPGVTRLRVVETLHERKAFMAELADAFAALPGGFGTLDELGEVLTLVQTGKSRRIPVILVGAGFWKGLLAWMEDKLVGEGMIGATDMSLMQVIDEPQAIVEAIFKFYETKGFVPTREEREKMLNL